MLGLDTNPLERSTLNASHSWVMRSMRALRDAWRLAAMLSGETFRKLDYALQRPSQRRNRTFDSMCRAFARYRRPSSSWTCRQKSPRFRCIRSSGPSTAISVHNNAKVKVRWQPPIADSSGKRLHLGWGGFSGRPRLHLYAPPFLSRRAAAPGSRNPVLPSRGSYTAEWTQQLALRREPGCTGGNTN